MKKGIITLFLVLFLILALIYLKPGSKDEKANGKVPEMKGKPALPVSVYVTKTDELQNIISSSGNVIANREVELRSEISGKITRIYFEEGSKVQKGDKLLKINDADLQAQLRKQEYQKKLYEDSEYRQKKLLEINAISREDYEIASNQLNTIKAEIDLLKVQIARTEINAPFNGIIGLQHVDEGSYISPNVRIASIQDIDQVKIDFSIPEKYMNAVRTGDSVRFTLSSSDEKFSGKVYAIEPKIDPATRTVQLRAVAANRDGKILPGAFANVELNLKKTENAILIPTEAVIPDLRGQKVFIVKNGMAQAQNVETGTRLESRIEITKGLQPGDSVITTGIMQVKPGAKVKIINVKKEK